MNPSRLQNLDSLRFLAVFLVLGRHLEICPYQVSPLLHYISKTWRTGGWIGVDLFFVLSGFLIGGLLFREHLLYGSISFKSFFIRRGFKIYPVFWIVICMTIVIEWVVYHQFKSREVFNELFFLQNYRGGLWDHTWSLAVEEHFYLILGLSLALLSRKSKEPERAFIRLPVILAGFCALILILRTIHGLTTPYHFFADFTPTHFRIDSLAFGVLLAYFYHFSSERFSRFLHRYGRICGLVGALLLITPFLSEPTENRLIYTVGFTVFYLASGGLLLFALSAGGSHALLNRFAAFLGAYSYAIYLWHLPMREWGVPAIRRLVSGPRNWFFYAAVYLVGSFILGVLTSRIVEQPFLHLRNRLWPSRSGSPLVVRNDPANTPVESSTVPQ